MRLSWAIPHDIRLIFPMQHREGHHKQDETWYVSFNPSYAFRLLNSDNSYTGRYKDPTTPTMRTLSAEVSQSSSCFAGTRPSIDSHDSFIRIPPRLREVPVSVSRPHARKPRPMFTSHRPLLRNGYALILVLMIHRKPPPLYAESAPQ
jgi:hypothetical protein